MLLDLFGETDMQAKANGACYDVCVCHRKASVLHQ